MRSELNSLRGSAFGWTDGTITAGSTPIRKVHMDQLRANTNWLEQNKCYTCDSCNSYVVLVTRIGDAPPVIFIWDAPATRFDVIVIEMKGRD